jgi:hypothetical protein
MTFDVWIAELERLVGKRIENADERESFRLIWKVGEEPQSVLDEWGWPETVH